MQIKKKLEKSAKPLWSKNKQNNFENLQLSKYYVVTNKTLT